MPMIGALPPSSVDDLDDVSRSTLTTKVRIGESTLPPMDETTLLPMDEGHASSFPRPEIDHEEKEEDDDADDEDEDDAFGRDAEDAEDDEDDEDGFGRDHEDDDISIFSVLETVVRPINASQAPLQPEVSNDAHRHGKVPWCKFCQTHTKRAVVFVAGNLAILTMICLIVGWELRRFLGTIPTWGRLYSEDQYREEVVILLRLLVSSYILSELELDSGRCYINFPHHLAFTSTHPARLGLPMKPEETRVMMACQQLDRTASAILAAADDFEDLGTLQANESDIEVPSARSFPTRRRRRGRGQASVAQAVGFVPSVTRSTHRSPPRNKLAERVRFAIRTLFNLPNYKGGLPEGPPDSVRRPSSSQFFIQWCEPWTSRWNDAARQVAVDWVLGIYSTHYSREKDEDNISQAVLVHFESLRHHYSPAVEGPPEHAIALQRRLLRRSRKRERFERRVDVVNDPRFPHLKRHEELLMKLGLQYTSSDEEVTDLGKPYLVSYRKFFLAPEISTLFAHLDKVHAEHFPLDVRPMARYQSMKTVQADVILGLPHNLYNPIWVTSLSRAEWAILAMRAERYDFSTNH